MDVNQAFPSNYLKAADLKGKGFKLQIKHVAMEEIGSGESKLVVYFDKTEKGLITNKTNAMTIAMAYGPETDGWVGKSVEVYPDTTMFQGNPVACIRVKAFYPMSNGAPGGAAGTAPGRQATPAPRADDELHDDSIPF